MMEALWRDSLQDLNEFVADNEIGAESVQSVGEVQTGFSATPALVVVGRDRGVKAMWMARMTETSAREVIAAKRFVAR